MNKEAMNWLMENRTSFMIAHHLGTLEKREIVLRNVDGRVTENEVTETAPAGLDA